MTKIKLVAFDLDYTMLKTGGILSEYAEKTLKTAEKMGVYVVPVTGRGITELSGLLSKIPARYVITVNGAVILDAISKKIILSTLPNQEKLLEKLKTALSLDIYTEVYCGGEVYTNTFCYHNMEKLGMMKDQLKLFKETRKVVPDLYGEMKKQGKMEKLHILFKSKEQKEALKNLFLGEREFDYTAAFPTNLELCAKGVDKGTALFSLSEILSVKREEVMAIGDGANDVPMIKWAGVGVAMENAVDEARAAADIITKTNDEDGAAQIIEKIVLDAIN